MIHKQSTAIQYRCRYMDKQDDIMKQADDAAILEIEEDMRVSEEYS